MGFNSALAVISEEDFKFILKNGKRSSVLLEHNFDSLTLCRWKFLKERMPDLIKIGNFEKLILEMFEDRGIILFPPDVENIDVSGVMRFVLWIVDEIEAITKMEQEHLVSEPDADLNAAGINELNIFGDYSSIRQIAIEFGITPNEVKEWRYHEVFDEQLYSIKSNRIEKRLIKIKNKPKGK